MRGNIVAAGSAIAAMGAVGVNAVDHPTFKVIGLMAVATGSQHRN
jgi:hypothetical protein